MAFKPRSRQQTNGDSEYKRITTVFKSEKQLPDFLKAKWTANLKAGTEYFEVLAQAVQDASEKGALFIDVSKPVDGEGNLVLTVAAFEPTPQKSSKPSKFQPKPFKKPVQEEEED